LYSRGDTPQKVAHGFKTEIGKEIVPDPKGWKDVTLLIRLRLETVAEKVKLFAVYQSPTGEASVKLGAMRVVVFGGHEDNQENQDKKTEHRFHDGDPFKKEWVDPFVASGPLRQPTPDKGIMGMGFRRLGSNRHQGLPCCLPETLLFSTKKTFQPSRWTPYSRRIPPHEAGIALKSASYIQILHKFIY